MNSTNEYLQFAKSLAKQAGKIMEHYFELEEKGVAIKSDTTPVTLADTEINSLVIKEVKSRFPEHGILGEEESFNLDAEYLWVVDPLDGTINFAKGIPPFAFSAALVKAGQLQVAVVYEPTTKRLLWAAAGQGAFENGKKLNIGDKNIPDSLLISSWIVGGIDNSIFSDKSVYGKAAMIYAQAGKIDVMDLPCAYGLALIGSNRIDGMVSSVKTPWDVAAGSLIAMEAGAKVTDLFGSRVKRWDKEANGILAAAPAVHEHLVSKLLPSLEGYA